MSSCAEPVVTGGGGADIKVSCINAVSLRIHWWLKGWKNDKEPNKERIQITSHVEY